MPTTLQTQDPGCFRVNLARAVQSTESPEPAGYHRLKVSGGGLRCYSPPGSAVANCQSGPELLVKRGRDRPSH
eukprot:1113469-Pyramimonas_sp.AAC.3